MPKGIAHRWTRVAAAVVVATTALVAQDPPAEEVQTQLVYQGEPLLAPLECRAADFLLAGVTCGEFNPCDMYLELVAISGSGETVMAVGNLHTSSATIASILLWSADGGVSWREPYERLGAAGFEVAQLADPRHAWAGGQQSDHDSSSTPFLLLTANGGDSWTHRPLWEKDTDGSGAIVEMHFEDAQHGYLIIDRLISLGDPYQLYESMNGGRSWGLRGISADIPHIPKTARIVVEPGWRIGEDAETGAYTIEKLDGTEWVVRSRFLVDLGQCRGMEDEVQR